LRLFCFTHKKKKKKNDQLTLLRSSKQTYRRHQSASEARSFTLAITE
jgi:hypothetical protein